MTETARPAEKWRPAGACSFLVCDIAQFSTTTRPDSIRVLMRAAMYQGLRRSFRDAGIDFDACHHEDRGDGVMIVIPPGVRTELLLTTVLTRLRAEVRHYNEGASDIARLRLRLAVHVGEAEADDHGIVSTALTHTFRILDSDPLREAARDAETHLALAVSQRVYDDVVRHGRNLIDPDDYYEVRIQVKETTDTAWITVPGTRPQRPPSSAVEPAGHAPKPPAIPDPAVPDPLPLDGASLTRVMFHVVEAMLAIRPLRTERTRDQLVSALSPDFAGAIPRSFEARADLFAILQTSLDYPGGLQELRQSIQGLVGNSLAVQHLDQTLARLLFPPPDDAI
jgi:Effector-associated domain 2